MKWRLAPIGLVCRIEKLLFWRLGFEIVLERENCTAASCIFFPENSEIPATSWMKTNCRTI